jgi:hypothetical protein
MSHDQNDWAPKGVLARHKYLFEPDYAHKLWVKIGGGDVPTFDTGDDAEPVRRTRKVNIPDSAGPDTMLRLEAAAALAFPDGSMTVASLRREAAAGRLAVFRIAGKDFTTLADVLEMKSKCRVPAKAQGSLSRRRKIDSGSGSSATASEPSAQAALKAAAKTLKESLRSTSPESTTPRPAGAAVIPMRSK